LTSPEFKAQRQVLAHQHRLSVIRLLHPHRPERLRDR
jgi:hypothetical protein